MKTQCPKCLAVYSAAADVSKIGTRVLCPKCGERFPLRRTPTEKPHEAEPPLRGSDSQEVDQFSNNLEPFLANVNQR